MDLVTWIIVGLVAGALASYVARGAGYGVVGNILLGIVGALFGGWGFERLGWHAPFAGVAGMICVAFVGATVVLLGIRVLMCKPL